MVNVSAATKFWPTAQEGFTTTLASTVSSGGTTVALNSVAGYVNGDTIVFVVDPTDVNKKQAFTGIVDTSGVQITGVIWTEGPNQTHTAGATVVDYETATAWALQAKGLKVSHSDDGTLKSAAVKTALGIVGTTPPDYTLLPYNPSSVVYNGNRSYTATFTGVDATTSINPGTRLVTTRTVPAPTQSTLLNGTTQYLSRLAASVAGMNFTDNFTVTTFRKPAAYQAETIAARVNTAGAMTDGWKVGINVSGQIIVIIRNGAAGNFRFITSAQSVSLTKWSHIAVTWAAGVVTMYLDGVLIPVSAATVSGTAPTATATAGGDFTIGRSSTTDGEYSSGKFAQTAVHSVVLTATQVKAIYSQGLTAADVAAYSIVSAFSLSGANGLTDINTTNANNLTANGGAVTTEADAPWGTQASGLISATLDYAIVQSAVFTGGNTVVVVQVPEGCTIPTSGGVSAVSYSGLKAPYGFPSQRRKWRIESPYRAPNTNKSNTTYVQWYGNQVTVPIGDWLLGEFVPFFIAANASTTSASYALSTSSTAVSDTDLVIGINNNTSGGSRNTARIEKQISLTAQTIYYGIGATGNASVTYGLLSDTTADVMYIENAYL